MKKISLVIPVYNEEQTIKTCYDRVTAVMARLSYEYEFIFVDDGSKDAGLAILQRIAADDKRVKIISFSRNFGQQTALTAGIDNAFGDCVVTLDVDMQDPPEIIPQMVEKWESGCDVVYARRVSRKGDTVFKKVTAKLFYRTMTKISDVQIPEDVGDFRLIDKKISDILRSMSEQNRYIRGLVSWIGFNQGFVDFKREERVAGTTKYPLNKMLHFAVDGITSFSYKPLRIAAYLGFAFSLVSFFYLIFIVVQRIWFSDSTITGWASTTAINLFFNGIVLMLLGIIGEYIGRIYDECKNRPQYIISKQVNFDEKD